MLSAIASSPIRLRARLCQAKSVGLLLLISFVILAGRGYPSAGQSSLVDRWPVLLALVVQGEKDRLEKKGPVSGGVLRSGAARQGIPSLGLQPAPAPNASLLLSIPCVVGGLVAGEKESHSGDQHRDMH